MVARTPPRDPPQPGFEFFEICARAGGDVAVLGKRGIDHESVFVLKALIKRGHAVEGADQQAGDDKKDATRRHLGADEESPGEGHPMALAREMKGGHQAEEQRGYDSHDDGKGRDAPIRRGIEPRRRLRHREHGLHHRPAKEQPRQRAKEGEKQALGEELADQTGCPRAYRDPHGRSRRRRLRRGSRTETARIISTRAPTSAAIGYTRSSRLCGGPEPRETDPTLCG